MSDVTQVAFGPVDGTARVRVTSPYNSCQRRRIFTVVRQTNLDRLRTHGRLVIRFCRLDKEFVSLSSSNNNNILQRPQQVYNNRTS